MNRPKNQYDETDLAVFPPYMSRFLSVILLLIFAHTASVLLLGLYLFPVDPGSMIIGGALSLLAIIISNILISRGHILFVSVNKTLAVLYGLIGVTSLVFSILEIKNAPWKLSLLSILFAAIALFTMSQPGYIVCTTFLKKRWDTFRATGQSVAEAMAKKRK